MTRFLTAALFAFILFPFSMHAQAGPEGGGHEWQVWTGGGHGTNGATSDTGVWNVGFRYGWILTDAIGPRPLRGKFEYAVDVVPIFLVTQTTNTAYGIGLNPFALKWNFATKGAVAPYIEIGGGLLLSNTEVPPGASHVNFTPTAAMGVHFLRKKYNWTAEVRYMHISNAGLASPNPGINTLQVRLGFGRFTQ
jgi:lipid A 3-O-deacylase